MPSACYLSMSCPPDSSKKVKLFLFSSVAHVGIILHSWNDSSFLRFSVNERIVSPVLLFKSETLPRL